MHVLVNNPGLSPVEGGLQISAESFGTAVSTNFDATLFGCQVFGEDFAERGYGRIVNIASLAGQNGGTATDAHYAPAKAGVATPTKVFACELGPHGVTVNAISPGPQDLPVVCRSGDPDTPARIEQTTPDGWGTPGSSPTWPSCSLPNTRTRSPERAGTPTAACSCTDRTVGEGME
ncbi:SDR family NAD(P)-dependent oxidoreductase [Streptomyces sp. NPDC007983]|uniref:SDR family NAD(P)-dependent oxidoreductase n=1 Tax=Streptomyces sp. NPDC007983 TaxID=3364800 RepID=UPI0036EAE1A4